MLPRILTYHFITRWSKQTRISAGLSFSTPACALKRNEPQLLTWQSRNQNAHPACPEGRVENRDKRGPTDTYIRILGIARLKDALPPRPKSTPYAKQCQFSCFTEKRQDLQTACSEGAQYYSPGQRPGFTDVIKG